MAEIWGAAIAGAAALGGGYLASQGAKKAGNASAAGSAAAIAEQRRQFDLARSDLAPYRAVGNQALNALASIYGYSPVASSPYSEAFAGATPVNAFAPQLGKFDKGMGALVNPYTLTSKLGDARYVFDPAGKLFGNILGNKHGDENRNLKAFAAESGVMQLADGRLALPNGAIFTQDQLKDVAGTWYGAVHHPDGDQAGWQQRYDSLIAGLGGGASSATPGADASSGYRITPGGGIDQMLQVAPGASGGMTPGSVGTNPLAGPNYAAFFASPDYTFRRDEGTRGIENSFSASGGAKSGNALKALADFNSNLAANEFGNYFNRQAALAGIGQTATNTGVIAGQNTANNVSNALVSGADARASGIGGGYDAWGNALGTIGGIGYNYFNRKPSGNPYIEPFIPTQRRVA